MIKDARRRHQSPASLFVRVYCFLRSLAIDLMKLIVYLFSCGKRVWGLQGYRQGAWYNWNKTQTARPQRFVTPRTEQELCLLVHDAKKVRVVGSGHSFNPISLTTDTMISLQFYCMLVRIDRSKKRVRVQAGMTLENFISLIKEQGWTIPPCGNTDQPTLGGLVATDFGDTGRDNAFFCEQIRTLRIVDAKGVAKDYDQNTDQFKAAIGGFGLIGVVVEIEIQCEENYNLRIQERIVDRSFVENNIGALLEKHDHLSVYYLTKTSPALVRLRTWDRTRAAISKYWASERMRREIADLIISGFIIPIASVSGIINPMMRLLARMYQRSENEVCTVEPGWMGTVRKLYFHHTEIDAGINYSDFLPCIHLLFSRLNKKKLACIVEVRFLPDKSKGMIGWAGQRVCHIGVNPSLACEPILPDIIRDVHTVFERFNGRPHFGKNFRIDRKRLKKQLGTRYDRFQRVRKKQDPDGKFLNPVAKKLFGRAQP